VHPPKDITDWPLTLYHQVKGLQSRTLHEAGWFPSGTLRVSLTSEGTPMATSAVLQNDEAQYNKRTRFHDVESDKSSTANIPSIQLNGTDNASTMILPSQLLESVTHRFEGEENNQQSSADNALQALRERRRNQQERTAREHVRFQKLESQIQRLEQQQQQQQQASQSTKNNKTVANQVQRMLIKSRATGAKTLKQMDRVL